MGAYVREEKIRMAEVINFPGTEPKDNVEKLPKLKKDGTPKQTRSNSKVNRDDVRPIKIEDVIKIIKYLDECIENSITNQAKFNNRRNKAYFVMGVNVGLRNGDLTSLAWWQIYDKNWSFHDSVKLTPEKTAKYDKKVKLFFNEAFKQAIEDFRIYVQPKNIEDYIFTTRESKNRSNKPISYKTAWDLMDKLGKAVGIEYAIATHSLRKTFCRQRYEQAEDKGKVLVELMRLLNHKDLKTTMIYIGIGDDELRALFYAVNLGL